MRTFKQINVELSATEKQVLKEAVYILYELDEHLSNHTDFDFDDLAQELSAITNCEVLTIEDED